MFEKNIKPIETYYKGYKFRSRLEARWAVFFDECGVDWDYEPEGFCIDGEINYLPDFLLHDVCVHGEGVFDLYVEIKGKPTEEDEFKIASFAFGEKSTPGIVQKIKNPILVLCNIPEGETFSQRKKYCEDHLFNGGVGGCYSHAFINHSWYSAIPGFNGNDEFEILNLEEDYFVDEEKTNLAYQKAQQARFEYGEGGK